VTVSQPRPRSVEYALALLALQATAWGLVFAVGAVALVLNARGIISGHGAPPHGAGAFAFDVVLLVAAAGMAAVSALVLAGLQRRRAVARVAAIALECVMTCFGVWLASSSMGGFIAGGGGAVLSCAAVACMLSRPARRYTRPAAAQPADLP
jgi:hypothetical protein